jgi:hypothetical protein
MCRAAAALVRSAFARCIAVLLSAADAANRLRWWELKQVTTLNEL